MEDNSAGPTTIEEALRWPSVAIANLDEDMRKRLAVTLSNGVCLHSAYSGIDTPVMALHLVQEALCRSGDLNPSAVGFMNVQCCEKDVECQRILCQLPGRWAWQP